VAIISVLKNHSQTIGCLHEDPNDYSVSVIPQEIRSTTIRTPGLHVHESARTTRLTTNVQEHRPAWFVERVIKIVSLRESAIVVRGVAIGIREVVNLHFLAKALLYAWPTCIKYLLLEVMRFIIFLITRLPLASHTRIPRETIESRLAGRQQSYQASCILHLDINTTREHEKDETEK
jgi:hypothetical protein